MRFVWPLCVAKIGAWAVGDLGVGVEVTVVEFAPQQARRLGSVLVTFAVTQNLGAIVVCSFIEVKGRFA
jgi:hypothetical protein